MIAINTDYQKSQGDPEPYLRQIAEAGFTYIHWCHQWSSDYIYADPEIDQIAHWLEEYGLTLLDLHASEGQEKYWLSEKEYARLAGVELIKNRIDMSSRLGSDVIVLHLQSEPDDEQDKATFWKRLRRSMNVLTLYARQRGVRIALENLFPINHVTIQKALAAYDQGDVGVCYDPGHGNIVEEGLEFLESVKDRLIALHLNDNDTTWDQHKILFTGTVDWEQLARIIAASPYDKPLTMELSMSFMDIKEQAEFLAQAYESGLKFAEMVGKERK